MRLICFYLPQYYPTSENDVWWGPGFTDWRNVARARPRFRGHRQPHVPADLGFYDLRLEETRVAQAELAVQYGIGGFCYYHYWFNGRLLLERPFNDVLDSGRPDLPFCLCWANENWTRRWDGHDQEILIGQHYDDYDPSMHVKWLERAFRDPRYIRIDGKPLFLVYRPDDIPNLADVVRAWRRGAEAAGQRGVYLSWVESSWSSRLSASQMLEMGFDSVVEFQPNPLAVGARPGHRLSNVIRRVINTAM